MEGDVSPQVTKFTSLESKIDCAPMSIPIVYFYNPKLDIQTTT